MRPGHGIANAIDTRMGRVNRTKDGVDAVEHALRGVHTSENHERIVSFERHPGFVGTHSIVQVDVVDDSPLEHEVIVRLSRTSTDR
jgi:hypothetical protein